MLGAPLPTPRASALLFCRVSLAACALGLALAACGGQASAPNLPPPAGGPAPPSWQAQAPYGAQPPQATYAPQAPQTAPPQAASNDPREASVPALLSSTLSALQQNRDEEAAAAAIVPYLHRSLLDASGTHLSTDVRSFSFKKAHVTAGLYTIPVTITRVRPSTTTAIGYGGAAEQGRLVDYFVGKRPGVNGMPAPVTVFFPASGGPPKVAYLGSL